MNLLTNWGDKSKTHNQMTPRGVRHRGQRHHWCHQVRVQQVTPANAGTPANHFFSIADMMEDGDDDFMERNGRDPDGALYKIYDNLASSGSAEKKTRLFEDKTDLDALIAGLNVGNTLATRRQYAYDNLDLPQCVSYFVGCILTSHQDHGHKNYYIYRDTPGTREWSSCRGTSISPGDATGRIARLLHRHHLHEQRPRHVQLCHAGQRREPALQPLRRAIPTSRGCQPPSFATWSCAGCGR